MTDITNIIKKAEAFHKAVAKLAGMQAKVTVQFYDTQGDTSELARGLLDAGGELAGNPRYPWATLKIGQHPDAEVTAFITQDVYAELLRNMGQQPVVFPTAETKPTEDLITIPL